MSLLDRLRDRAPGISERDAAGCRCDPEFREPTGLGVGDRVVLAVDAADCRGDGDLAGSPACRATVVDALTDRDADVVVTSTAGLDRVYADGAAGLLLAAGRFREQVAFHDERLAELAARDPLAAAREACGRADPVARIAAETGLMAAGAATDDYRETLRAFEGPSVSTARVATRLPADAQLVDRWTTATDATVRLYDDDPLRYYHLTPPESDLDADAYATLAAAKSRLLSEEAGGQRAPGRAVRAVAGPDEPVEDLTDALRRHTAGHGMLDHVFADDRVSDAFLTPPIAETTLTVVVDGERLRTNVRIPPVGAATLASRLRRASGSGFSRASPTLDATLETAGGPVRVAATTKPASDGLAFAFRRNDVEAWTLPRLVARGTLSPAAAGLLSVAVSRGAAGLVAGGRGAGKTTTLGALLWELDAGTRTILLEDAPELPAAALREAGRDVQRLRVDAGDGPEPSPTAAVRTALRLGDGALVVGEVRGSEASSLYEAMRVGAGTDTVLGTIHGETAAAVRERVVTDLDVPPSSFASTDLLVTLADHEVRTITEVSGGRDGAVIDHLFERADDELVPTGRVDRGNSGLVAALAGPAETYDDVRTAISSRGERIGTLAEAGRTRPADVVDEPAEGAL